MEEVVNVWIFETLEVKVNHVAFTLTWEPTEDFWQGSHMPGLGFVCLFFLAWVFKVLLWTLFGK